MNQDQFVARRQEAWQELAGILAAAERRGPRRLSLEQVERLGLLYRRAASDLAYARTYFPNGQATAYLNQLVSRAHNLIYAEEPQRLRSLWRLFAHTVPATVRGAWRPLLLSAVLMGLGGLVGFFAILSDPNLAEALVPPELRHHEATAPDGDIFPVQFRSLIGTAILINNVRVGVMAFGLGITLGVGTALVLLYNGLIVGALAAHYFRAGLSFSFWALILPHGVLELMALFLAGAAGFCLGWPLVAPGRLTRGAAFRSGARRAGILILGSLPLFVVAAAIEGFITPMGSLSEWGKYGVALVTGALGVAYWALGGRRAAGAPADTDAQAPPAGTGSTAAPVP
ncbi:stage II sporulation protein M [Symbiobacterium thermophilum]|nr:stage II sporulation protein M [Symbiobacterium thermophilum]